MNIETQKIQDLVQSSSEYYDEEVDEDLARTLLEKLKIEKLIAELLTNFFSAVSSANLKGVSKALEAIQILLASERESIVNTVIKSDALSLIFEFLNKNYENCEHIQNSCTKILISAVKLPELVQLVYEKKIHLIVSQNILAQSETLRDLTLQLLTVLAQSSTDIKFELLTANFSEGLVNMLRGLSLNPGLLFNCIKLILVLLRQKAINQEVLKEQYALLDILFEFFKSEDFLVLGETFLALGELFETDAYQEKVTDKNLFQQILMLVEIDNVELKYNILRTIKNICRWGDDYCQYFLENKILYQANDCLNSKCKSIPLKRVSIEMVTVFFARKLAFLQVVFDFEKGEIIKRLIEVMKYGEEDLPALAFNAMTVSCAEGNFKEIKVLIDKGYLDIVGTVLKKPKDMEIKGLCEKSLEAIVYKTQQEFGKEKHPMIMQCYMKVQAIVKSIYGNAPNNLTAAIGIISMENQKNFRPDSNI